MRTVFVSLFLIHAVVTPPAFIDNKREGSYIELQKQDGEIIAGELFSVRRNMVIVQKYSYGSYEFVNLSDIEVLKIQKSSRWLSAGLGFLRGCITGAVIGDLSAKSTSSPSEKRTIVIIGGALGGTIGAIMGQFKGTPVKKYDTYFFKGKTKDEISAILREISPKARVQE